jgi:hypothetical protein
MQVQSALLFETPEQICARVYSALRPRARLPEIQITFRKFASANSFARLADGRLEFRVTDVLQGAPAHILESLVYILLSKLFRKPVPAVYNDRYRRYLNRREMTRSLNLLRQIRGHKFVSGPQGNHYNLEDLFEELNGRFFDGLLGRPLLGWSRRVSRTTLGHYDPSHNAIILSKLFDDPAVPRLAVEYVLYHEMLHLRYPVEIQGAYRRVHTTEFRHGEKQFPRYQEAQQLLKKLCSRT